MKSKTKLRVIRFLLFVSTVISLYFVPWPIVMAWIAPLPDTVQDQVNRAEDYGFDGIVVYVDVEGLKSQFYVSGYKNRESKQPADPHALFKIASVGKLYDALAVTRLISKGYFSPDSTITAYLPELKGKIVNADKVTIRMLVQHRSGLPNFTDTYNFWSEPNKSDQEKLALVEGMPADFEPDSHYKYCNTNYLLLALIMKRVLGYPHFQFIKTEFLEPLGLNRTYASIKDVNPEEVMSGYYVGYDGDLKEADYGSMLASAEDLGRFIRALNEGSLFLNKDEQALYHSLYKLGHTGLIPGYQTIAKFHDDLNAVVVQFTNTVNFEGYNWNLSEVMYSRIIKILRKKALRKD